jgi:hypothetical protein
VVEREITNPIEAVSKGASLHAHNLEEIHEKGFITSWGSGWEDGIPRTSKGILTRVNKLRALGNAVVPAQAYPIFRAIVEAEKD